MEPYNIEEFISPSGKYKLTVTWYKTNNIFCLTAKRIITESNKFIIELPQIETGNRLMQSFFYKNGDEWLVVTGESESSKYFVNIDARKCYNIKTDSRNSDKWHKVEINSDETILVVSLSVRKCDNVIKFYDFSEPDKGCNKLKIIGLPDKDNLYDVCGHNITWIDDVTCEFIELCQYSKTCRCDFECLPIEHPHKQSVFRDKQLSDSDLCIKPKSSIILRKEDNHMKVCKIVDLLRDDV